VNTPKPKIFWNDIETGGTDPKTDALLQIAFIIDDGTGAELATFNSYIAPLKGDLIHDEALAKNGITREQIKTFPDPYLVYHSMRQILGQHGYCKRKDLRYIPAGYNNQFDLDFILAWMTKLDSKFAFWDFLQFRPFDPLPILRALQHSKIIDLPNLELKTVCDHLKIPIEAHNALSDIRATKEVTTRLYTKIFKLWTGNEYTLLGPR
jgi:DNA polymerase III subunit epsilon